MQDDGNKKHRPPNQPRTLNACSHPGEEGGRGTLTRKCAHTERNQGPEGDPLKQQRATLARGHGREEDGGPPTRQRAQTARGQESEGETLARLCATPSHGQGEEEEWNPPNRSACSTHAHGGDRGTPQPGSALTRRAAKERRKGGTPLNCSMRTPRMTCMREIGGEALKQMWKGGHPPRSVHI